MSILDEVSQIEDKLIQIRRQVHQNPELGFQETETAALVKQKLTELDIPFKSEIAKTGIVAVIEGKQPGKTLLLRADMDALPLQEDVDVPFKSKNDGVMHACGHDCHVACLLGAAEILVAKKNEFTGKILLVFQPAEESSGTHLHNLAGGAAPMIYEGGIGDPKNPEIDGALALHVSSGSKVGTITAHPGPAMGSSDIINIDIIGKGGHGSAPHQTIDPIFLAAQIYQAIQGFVTRKIAPVEARVITIGKIIAGDRHNIISSTARMEGTMRTLNKEVQDYIHAELPKLVKGIAQAHGGDANVEIIKGYPVGVNNVDMVEIIKQATNEVLGPDAYSEGVPILGAEDFYAFGFEGTVPAALFFLGGANPDKGITAPNHSNLFNFDEDAIKLGTSVMVASALRFLSH